LYLNSPRKKSTLLRFRKWGRGFRLEAIFDKIRRERRWRFIVTNGVGRMPDHEFGTALFRDPAWD
jgi:hypothetical protein